MIRFLPLIVVVACGGASKEDSAATSPSDTAGTTDSTDPGIPLRLTYVDGFTGVGISAAEVCTVIPETDTPCQTTDADGVLETEWQVSEFTNVLNRLTHEDYTTTLYAGRYEQDVQDGWTAALETSDVIELGFIAFTPAVIQTYLSTGSVVAEPGQGLVVYWLFSGDDSSMAGAVITLEDDTGASVGQVLYQTTSNVLNPMLTATTAAGVVAIANVPPGSHTLRVSHDTLTCVPSFAFASDVPNVTTVPVEADSQTLGNLICFEG